MIWDKIYFINFWLIFNCIEEKYFYLMLLVVLFFDNRLLFYDCSDDEGKFVFYNFRLNLYGKFFIEFCYYLGSVVFYF